MTSREALLKPYLYSDIEPLPDPHREPDMLQEDTMYYFYAALRPHFINRPDAFICGAGYLRLDPDDNGDAAPDGVVALGVRDPQRIIRRNGYVISEVGKPPDLVLEVASRSTGRRDYTEKREIYAAYGVREYWRFDPSGGSYHDAPLAGDTLEGGSYTRLPIVEESNGRHWGYSEVLGLEIWWDDGIIRFRDPITGEFLRMPEAEREARQDAEYKAEAAELQAESERQARQRAESQTESERQARQDAEARMAEMEAELIRLRGHRPPTAD